MSSPATHQFDSAVSVTPRGGGVYDAPIRDGWDINGNANGGYLMALVGNAMRAESGRAHPISVSMHYLAPGPAGDGTVTARVMKNGKRFTTVAATLSRDGRDLVTALGVFGDVDSSVPPHSVSLDHVDVPPFDECPSRAGEAIPIGLMGNIDVRIHPDDTGFSRGEPSGEALCRGYFAFRDGRDIDTLALLLVADSFPPVMFNRFGMQGWVPTVEMTVHVRGVPAPGPITCAFRSRVIQGGMWEEDGEMWDSNGQVVALSRQLALAPLVR